MGGSLCLTTRGRALLLPRLQDRDKFLAMSFHGQDADTSWQAACATTPVAGQALRVVESRLMVRVLMGIVAGKTTDPAIVRIEAAAFSQPIGLKAGGHRPLQVKRLHVRSGAMTGAAELHKVSGCQGGGIEDVRLLQLAGLHRRHVLRSRAMAAFTGDSWSQLIKFQTAVAHRPGRMTPEAGADLLWLYHASQGILQGWGNSG